MAEQGDAPGHSSVLQCQMNESSSSNDSLHAPSMSELKRGFLLGNQASLSSEEAVRVMLFQNNLVLRYIMSRRCKSGTASSSIMSSLTTSGSKSALNDLSPRSQGCHVDGSMVVSALQASSLAEGNPIGVIDSVVVSPPKIFKCPLCPKVLNESDFDRHVKEWVKKSTRGGRGRRHHCPGLRTPEHPYLRSYPGGDLGSKVQRLVDDVRRLLKPGSNSARSAAGSGRHVVVQAFFAHLLEATAQFAAAAVTTDSDIGE